MPIHVSILSERRVFSPYGMSGGENGLKGMNFLLRLLDGGEYRWINFGGKNSTVVKPGDRLRIETPGGGGWGEISNQ
jgi:5-oxoprolinase (ATP-hydrolysing)